MNTTKLKQKVRNHAPSIVAGAALGVAVTATISRKMYHPKDKVAIQFPKGVVEMMQETGRGLAVNSDAGWFTIKYHPQD